MLNAHQAMFKGAIIHTYPKCFHTLPINNIKWNNTQTRRIQLRGGRHLVADGGHKSILSFKTRGAFGRFMMRSSGCWMAYNEVQRVLIQRRLRTTTLENRDRESCPESIWKRCIIPLDEKKSIHPPSRSKPHILSQCFFKIYCCFRTGQWVQLDRTSQDTPEPII